MDLLGVLVLSVATGVGGGILRDILIGSVPPAALRDETYLLVCFLGVLLVFLAAPKIASLPESPTELTHRHNEGKKKQ